MLIYRQIGVFHLTSANGPTKKTCLNSFIPKMYGTNRHLLEHSDPPTELISIGKLLNYPLNTLFVNISIIALHIAE